MSDLARAPKQIGSIIRRSRNRLGVCQSALGEQTRLRQETTSLIETNNPATCLDTILVAPAELDLEFQIGSRTRQQDVDHLIG
jgi:HTH-type transcriptional regulator/antitoxin HipB